MYCGKFKTFSTDSLNDLSDPPEMVNVTKDVSNFLRNMFGQTNASRVIMRRNLLAFFEAR